MEIYEQGLCKDARVGSLKQTLVNIFGLTLIQQVKWEWESSSLTNMLG